jgi:hypothetical protein
MAKYGYYAADFVRTWTMPETGLLPAVKFRYRPLNSEEAGAEETKVVNLAKEGKQKVQVDLFYRYARECISKKVLEWDLVKPPVADNDPEPVDLRDPAELRRVDPHIIEYIYEHIRKGSGNIPTDLPSDELETADELKAIKRGKEEAEVEKN